MTASGGPKPATKPVRSIADIPGWFAPVDQWLFEHFLSGDAVVPRGDLVEVGAYMGKSAALIGTYKRSDEVFTVCDLFGAPAGDSDNEVENDHSYAALSRDKFEHNYLAIHPELPVVVQDLSSAVVDHVKPGSARFVHVDASHLYAHVAVDVDSARTMLLPEGVVSFDDFRSPHTPGVAAAVWEAVFTKGLHPICLTRKKLYATFGDAEPHRARVEAWLATSERFQCEIQQIGGAPVVRIKELPARAAAPAITPADFKRLTAQLGAIAKNVAAVEQKVSSVNGKVGTVERSVGKLQRSQGTKPQSTVERGLRRVVRAVRARSARR